MKNVSSSITLNLQKYNSKEIMLLTYIYNKALIWSIYKTVQLEWVLLFRKDLHGKVKWKPWANYVVNSISVVT